MRTQALLLRRTLPQARSCQSQAPGEVVRLCSPGGACTSMMFLRKAANPAHLGHHGARPVGDLARRIGKRQGNHTFRHIARKRWDAGGARLIPQQAVRTALHEPLLPTPDGSLCYARRAHDLGCAVAVSRHEHDLCPSNVFLRAVAVGHAGEQRFAVGRHDIDSDPGAHTPNSHGAPRRGKRIRTLRQVLSTSVLIANSLRRKILSVWP